MRQVLQNELKQEGSFCKCIRCREIKNNEFNIEDLYYNVQSYEASYGKEYFISANVKNIKGSQDYLVGFCRMRLRNYDKVYKDFTKNYEDTNFINALENCSLIREMHVYGKMVPSYLSKFEKSNSQHRGIGKHMLKIAENIAINQGFNKMAIISGVGVRGFYRKSGYEVEDNYMTKRLTYNIFNYLTPFMIHVLTLIFTILYCYITH